MMADSEMVYAWPEFQALAARLGIPLDLEWLGVEICLERGCAVIVKHEYVAADRKKSQAAELRKQAITTVADLAALARDPSVSVAGLKRGSNPAA